MSRLHKSTGCLTAAALLTLVATGALRASGVGGRIAAFTASQPATAAATAPATHPSLEQQAKELSQELLDHFGEGYRSRIDRKRNLVYVVAVDRSTLSYVMRVLGAYNDAERKMLFRTPLRWNVAIVMPTLADFRKLTPTDKAAGFYRQQSKMLVSVTLGTALIHEFTHALHHNDQAAAGQTHAMWVIEGLASLFQDSSIDAKGKIEIRDGPSLSAAQQALREGKALTLPQLLRADAAAFTSSDEICYPQARSVLLYLYRMDKLEQFYESYKATYDRDPTGGLALTAATGDNLEQFEANWREWVLAQETWQPPKARAYLGVRMQADEGGVRVTGFARNSPAARARKIKVGDVIVSFAGQPTPTPQAVGEAVDSCLPGATVDIEIVRDGKMIVVRQLLGYVR